MKYYIYIYINYLKKKHVDWIPCYFSHIPLNFSSCLALNKCEPAYPLSPHWVQAKDLTYSLLHPNQKKNHIPHQFHAINTNTNQKRKKKRKSSNRSLSLNRVANFQAPTMATNAVKSKKSTPSFDKTSARIWFYSLLLTLQYGAQPLISKRFIR